MRVTDILNKIEGKILTNDQSDVFFEGIYAGDLLSNVMSHARENNLLLTIMSNMNTIAVACLLDLPIILFAEGVIPTDEMIDKANEEKIMLISSKYSVVDIIRKLYGI